MALISMFIIVVTVISQGWRVPNELRGELRGSLFINSGVFQAIGVISFGNDTPIRLTPDVRLTLTSFRLPYVEQAIPISLLDKLIPALRPQQPSHLWIPSDSNNGQVRKGDPLFNFHIHDRLPAHGLGWIPDLW